MVLGRAAQCRSTPWVQHPSRSPEVDGRWGWLCAPLPQVLRAGSLHVQLPGPPRSEMQLGKCKRKKELRGQILPLSVGWGGLWIPGIKPQGCSFMAQGPAQRCWLTLALPSAGSFHKTFLLPPCSFWWVLIPSFYHHHSPRQWFK